MSLNIKFEKPVFFSALEGDRGVLMCGTHFFICLQSSPYFGVNFSVVINHSNSMYSRNCNLPWLNEIVNALPR